MYKQFNVKQCRVLVPCAGTCRAGLRPRCFGSVPKKKQCQLPVSKASGSLRNQKSGRNNAINVFFTNPRGSWWMATHGMFMPDFWSPWQLEMLWHPNPLVFRAWPQNNIINDYQRMCVCTYIYSTYHVYIDVALFFRNGYAVIIRFSELHLSFMAATSLRQ